MDYMNQAFICANKALEHDDVPVGAVIVMNGKIIGRGRNKVELKQNPTLHAEIDAINKATKKLGTKFLNNCEIYVTLEPCPMCATAISYARIKKMYFAALDEKGGAILQNSKLFETHKNLWKPEIERQSVHAEKASKLLKDFFKNKRKSQN